MKTKTWRNGGVTKVTPSERGVWIVYYSDADPLPGQTRSPFSIGKADIYYGAEARPGTHQNVYVVAGKEIYHESVKGEYKTRQEAEERMAELYEMRTDGILV